MNKAIKVLATFSAITFSLVAGYCLDLKTALGILAILAVFELLGIIFE